MVIVGSMTIVPNDSNLGLNARLYFRHEMFEFIEQLNEAYFLCVWKAVNVLRKQNARTQN